MILRKPYAFLIKHFKLLHLILAVLLGYLAYRTGRIMLFLNDYIKNPSTSGGEFVSGLYNVLMYIIPILVIIVSLVIIFTFVKKKKPYVFYFVLIIMSLAITILYVVSKGIITELEVRLLDIRSLKLLSDFITMGFIVQIVGIVITLIRASGFDFNKFDFSKDLAELEVTEADNEEFEFTINVDSDKAKRSVRKKVRGFKYFYLENQFIINSLLLIVVTVFLGNWFLQTFIYNKDENLNSYFGTKEFSMNVVDSFVTDRGMDNKELDKDKSYVIVRIKIKSLGNKSRKLTEARIPLVAVNHKFYPTIKYFEKFEDLGNVYSKQVISSKDGYQNYILVYEVPRAFKTKKMNILYTDDLGFFEFDVKRINVDLKPVNLDKTKEAELLIIGEEVELKDSIFKKSKLMIKSFDIKDSYKLEYEFCSAKDNCYPSVEYVYPSIFNNKDKALIRINGYIEWDKELPINKTNSFYSFINRFGTFSYVINNKEYKQTSILKEVQTQKIKYKNNYFIEVDKEMLKADKIYIDFNIRNIKYRYVLK